MDELLGKRTLCLPMEPTPAVSSNTEEHGSTQCLPQHCTPAKHTHNSGIKICVSAPTTELLVSTGLVCVHINVAP